MSDTLNTNQTRVYALSGQNGAITDSYTSAPLSAFAWVLDPAAGATKSPPTANTAATPWKLAANWHAEINFRAYCRGYFINTSAVTAALASIDRLGTPEVPPQKLLDATQIHVIVTRLFEYSSTNGAEAEGMIEKFLTRLSELKVLLDGGFSQAAKDNTTTFYTQSATISKVDEVFTRVARTVHARAVALYNANLPTPISPGDSGA